VRELRQHLSRYLRRVAAGESLEVTERNKPIAVLGPAAPSGSALARLVLSGRARPAGGDLLDVPLPRGLISTRGTDALQALRAER